MADEETEQDPSPQIGTEQMVSTLRDRLQELATALKDSPEPPVQSASVYCQKFCQVLVEFAGQWKIDVHPLPLLEVYTEAILSYASAAPYLCSECESVPLLLERLSLSCVELLLAQAEKIPAALWERFQSSVQSAHSLLLQNGNAQLCMLSALAQENGVWSNSTLCQILSKDTPQTEKVHEFLALEGPILLEMRIKHLIKENHVEKAALLAKECSECPDFRGRGTFKQTYLVCLCAIGPQEQLMQKISEVDCKDALEMVCNLESDGDERGALSLCSAFLTRQIIQGDVYCAWELTLFWSKLLKRVEPSAQVFLDRCCQLSRLSKSVYHILFLIKVIQSELEDVGLHVCIEMCIRALQMVSGSDGNVKATICKTISCLLPTDLEVRRACQLTEFLLEPTVDSYYAVETLYNEPDQKLEEENLPVPNSLRCELLLVFKTQWPFDPEFWDWKTLKRHCLVLMGEQASIVSSIDELNDTTYLDQVEDDDDLSKSHEEFKDPTEYFLDTTNQLNEIGDEKQKKREVKKLREKGFISARFRNWQAYVQYCVLCDKEFLGHRIVRHAQKHFVDGVYSCPICAANFDSKEQLMPHVASHVKQSCKERLAAMKSSKALANSSKKIIPGSSSQNGTVEKLDCKPKTKGKADNNDSPSTTNSDCEETVTSKPEITAFGEEKNEEHSCPVTNCCKSFKFFRNMIAHVKTHGDNEEARRFLEIQSKKVVCHFCRRHFVSIAHLNDHLQMHCGDKPYICVQMNCKASFLTNAELLMHRKEHTTFKAKCMFPKCGRIFSEAYMLYDHEAQHYNTFTCKVAGCGKIFHAQSQLDLHQEDHLKKEDPLNIEDQSLLPDLNIESPAQIPIDQTPDCSTPVDPKPSGSQVSLPQGEVQSTSSNLTNEKKDQQAAPVEIKHSVERMLNTSVGPVQGSDHSLPFKPESADSHQEQFPLPNSEDPMTQSSTSMYTSNQPGLLNEAPSHLHDVRQTRPHSQICTPASCQSVTPESHAPLHPNLQQPQVQNVGLFPTPEQNLLPSQHPDWRSSHSQTGTYLQDPKLHPYAWNHTEVSHGVQCKGDVPDSFQLALSQDQNIMTNEGRSECRVSALENPSCMFLDNRPAPEQTLPCMPAVIPATPKSVASCVTYPQSVPQPVVGSATAGTASHYTCKTSPAPPEAVKQRHYCPYETCTRNYSCPKSVSKHMKAAHPEFFIEWKLAKQNAKAIKAATRKVPADGNKAVPNVCTQSTANQQLLGQMGCRNIVASSENPTGNVLNSVLFSQSGKAQSECVPTWTGMQTATAHSSLWPLHAGNNSSISGQTDCASVSLPPPLPSNHQFLPHMNQSSTSYPSQTSATCTPPFTQDGTTAAVFNGEPNTMNRLLADQDATNSLVSVQTYSGSWQSEIPLTEINASPVFGSLQPDKADSKITPISADGKTSEHDKISQPTLQNLNDKTRNPVFHSNVNHGSQLSALLSGESLCSSHVITSIPAPRMDVKDETLVHSISSCHTTPPNTEELPSSLLPSAVEYGSHSFLPSTSASLKDSASQDQLDKPVNPVIPSQMQNSSFSGVTASERMGCPQKNPGFQSEGETSHTGAHISLSGSGKISRQDETMQGVKKIKRDKRTKWPAIVKDGKFICCRCFREFQSPKSLGGHLSKRSLCKDLNETDSTTGLATSLQDIKSPHTPNAYCQPKFDPNMAFKDELKPCSSVNFPQTNIEQNSETPKPLIGNPSLRNLFSSSQIPQGTLQKACDTYSDGFLPENTVIQQTGNVHFKTESEHTKDDIGNSEETHLDNSVLSDSFPSQLAQTSLPLAPNVHSATHLNEMLRAEALRKLTELKGKAGQSNDSLVAAIASLAQNLRTDSSPHVTSPDPLQPPLLSGIQLDYPQKKNCEENIKKKLRDQILAGDLLRVGNVCRERSPDASASSDVSGVPQVLRRYQSLEYSRVTQKAPNGAQFNSSEASTVSPCLANGALLLQSDTQQNGGSVSGEIPANHTDQAPAQSPGEDEKITEIQRALQKLDLEDHSAMSSCSSTASVKNEVSDNLDSLKPVAQNLILHYKAVHQSALPKFDEHNKDEQDEEHCEVTAEGEEEIAKEYTEHVKQDHKMTKLSKTDGAEGVFKCEYDGCDQRYIEEQRSGFIFCKKYSRSKCKDADRSAESSAESSENEDSDGMGPEESDTESSKQIPVKEDSCELPEAKQLSDESSETKSVMQMPIKRKRGRPRKTDCPGRQPVASGSRRESLRNKVNQVTNSMDSPRRPRVQEEQSEKNISLSSFRPMGFEASFLKFLEESTEPPHTPKRKAAGGVSEVPSKRRRTLQQKTVNIMCERPYAYRRARDRQSLVDFRNPLKLKSVKNVKIVVDRTFSSGAELLLKQLQEMRPMVVLKKWLYS
ncbi:zinc finger protein 292-like [Megalops cyprinoides]|uniref:zinc finger protein 292-like n=1 Tax=Megalops cyprinoides TaxID=118141 RepID=UPI001864831B|nr:zinc finger protein 292-like [Megalops cyprinoides]